MLPQQSDLHPEPHQITCTLCHCSSSLQTLAVVLGVVSDDITQEVKRCVSARLQCMLMLQQFALISLQHDCSMILCLWSTCAGCSAALCSARLQTDQPAAVCRACSRTRDFSELMEADPALLCSIREGNYAVLTEGHILLLNWNRQTAPLLRQLALAQKQQFTSKPRCASCAALCSCVQHTGGLDCSLRAPFCCSTGTARLRPCCGSLRSRRSS